MVALRGCFRTRGIKSEKNRRHRPGKGERAEEVWTSRYVGTGVPVSDI